MYIEIDNLKRRLTKCELANIDLKSQLKAVIAEKGIVGIDEGIQQYQHESTKQILQKLNENKKEFNKKFSVIQSKVNKEG